METFMAAYARLNPGQKEAVDAIRGPVMVVAGPGTGKTEVLALRIANILRRTGVAPDRILALTFTESGAVAMRRRLASLAGAAAYRVQITTFHGFANGLIGEHPDAFPEIAGGRAISDIDQVRILRSIFDRTPFEHIRPFGDRYWYLKPVMRAIDELKRQGIPAETFKALAEEEKERIGKADDLIYADGPHKGKMKGKYRDALKHAGRNAECAQAYAAYGRALAETKSYDWNDMVMKAMAALERNDGLRLAAQETFEYVLVDEHQDTNGAQGKIAELVAGSGTEPNLFVVGDEKQAIFRFQGASAANFRRFGERYPGARMIQLAGNYRSGQAILDAAEAVSPRETPLAAADGAGGYGAHFAECSSPDSELYFVAKKAAKLAAEGVPLEEIAVLFRANSEAPEICRALEREGIPANVESDQDALEDPDIGNVMKVARAACRFGSAPELFQAIHADFLRIPPLDIWKLSSWSAKKRMNPYDVMRSEEAAREADMEDAPRMAWLFRMLSLLKRSAENRPATEAFGDVVRQSGFLAAMLERPDAREKLRKLHALFDRAKELVASSRGARLEDLLSALDLMAEHGLPLRGGNAERVPGRVRLMTAHKSKGLEFGCVFVVNAASGVWDSARRTEHIRLPLAVYGALKRAEAELGNEESDEDDRNLFYVAMTRARKGLWVTLSRTRRDGREQLPTRFVAEMAAGALAKTDTEPYEKEWAARPGRAFMQEPEGTPEIEDREFIAHLFAEQGLSATALDNFLECPWKWLYLNLLRIPEAPNKHLMYGNAVHEALKNFFDGFGGEDGKDAARLIGHFERALEKQPIGERDFEEALAKGRKSLAAWHARYAPSWHGTCVTERRVSGITVGADVPITGKIDKIEFAAGSASVNVVDYKTGRPKSRNAIEGKTADGSNYRRQLVFYRLLLEREGKYDMASGDIDFVEPDEKGLFHKERFAVGKEDAAELEAVIVKAAAEIRALSFWNTYCKNRECPYCALRKEIADRK